MLVLAAFTLIFLIVTAALWPMAQYTEEYMTDYLDTRHAVKSLGTDVPTLVALLVCLIPTTIWRFACRYRHRRHGPSPAGDLMAKSGKAVEAAGDIDTLLLDKTGTITVGNRRPNGSFPCGDIR